jgi:hypothetical protein
MNLWTFKILFKYEYSFPIIACQAGDQQMCQSYMQTQSTTQSCGQQNIAVSCPNMCQLCAGTGGGAGVYNPTYAGGGYNPGYGKKKK